MDEGYLIVSNATEYESSMLLVDSIRKFDLNRPITVVIVSNLDILQDLKSNFEKVTFKYIKNLSELFTNTNTSLWYSFTMILYPGMLFLDNTLEIFWERLKYNSLGIRHGVFIFNTKESTKNKKIFESIHLMLLNLQVFGIDSKQKNNEIIQKVCDRIQDLHYDGQFDVMKSAIGLISDFRNHDPVKNRIWKIDKFIYKFGNWKPNGLLIYNASHTKLLIGENE